MKNTVIKRILTTAGAVLAIVLTWQQLGWPMPASQASIIALAAYGEETRLLVLYHQLDDARHSLHDAKENDNKPLVLELEKRISHIRREIKKLEEK